jgi:hypothetical protein
MVINMGLRKVLLPSICVLTLLLAVPLKAAVIYTSPVTGVVGEGGPYSGANWYHQIYQNTGQNQYLEQFALHVKVGSSGSTHNLTGIYGLDVYALSAGARGSLLGSFTPTSISSQFTSGSTSYRTFTFDLLSASILMPTQSGVLLHFNPSVDTVPTYTHATGIAASPGFSVGGKLLSGGTLYNVGSTLGTVSVSSVPEPSALSLLAVGLGGVIALRRVRRRTD